MSGARANTVQCRLLLWAAGGLTFGIAISAPAATLRVPADYPTIQSAVDVAKWSDVVLVAPGTYTMTEARTIEFSPGNPAGNETHRAIAFLKGGLQLVSESGPAATILEVTESGDRNHCLAACLDYGLDPSLLKGFTFRKPSGHGAEVYIREMAHDWTFTVEDCVFEDSEGGQFDSGGFDYRSPSPILIKNCRFTNLTSLGGHGALRAFDGSRKLTLESCVFENCPNSAVRSTSIFFTIRNSTFRNCNTGSTSGGSALEGFASAHFFVDGCLFEQCTNTSVVLNAPYAVWPEIRRSTFVGCSGFSGVANLKSASLIVEDCRFMSCLGSASAGLRMIRQNGTQDVRIRHNVFYRVDSEGPYGAIHGIALNGDISNNTFVECSVGRTLLGAAIFSGGSGLTLANNIFSKNGGSSSVYRFGGTIVEGCNDYWMNSGSNANFQLAPTSFFADPYFCDPDVGDFALRPESPCAPPGPTGCGLLGALGVLCGPVSVESMSWGKIKTLYR